MDNGNLINGADPKRVSSANGQWHFWRVLFIAGVFFFLLMLLGKFLVVNTRLKPADVIAVLSGNDQTRLIDAARLYHQRLSDAILLTNTGRTYGDYDSPYSQLQVERLKELDVPEGALHLVNFVAKNTGQEATGIIEQMVDMSAKSVIIVTDSWHTRRVKIIFSDTFANTGFTVQYYGSGKNKFHPALWWLSPQGWKDVTGEYIRIIGYLIKRSTNIPDYPVFRFLRKIQ